MKAPFSNYLGLEPVRAENGLAEFALELQPHHLNRRGVAHGGVLTALLDSSLGAAVVSAIPQPWWCATTSLSVQFLCGVSTGRLTASGRVLRRGRRTAFASGEVHDARGRLIATAHGTWRLWPQRPAATNAVQTGSILSRSTGEPLRVGKILAAGRNYADHIAEMGEPEKKPPVIFLKPTSALALDGSTIQIPTAAGQVHHEVELVVVIGKQGKSIPEEQALEHVLGYAVGLDLTLRDLQSEAKKRGEPWTLSKGFDGSAPVSAFAPRDEVGDGSGLELTLDVNGQRRQHGNTSHMLSTVPELIAFASRWMTLERGDLLFTGTPAGVGPVTPGDLLEARLEKVGELRIKVEAESG